MDEAWLQNKLACEDLMDGAEPRDKRFDSVVISVDGMVWTFKAGQLRYYPDNSSPTHVLIWTRSSQHLISHPDIDYIRYP
jgi:hypothetical protein